MARTFAVAAGGHLRLRWRLSVATARRLRAGSYALVARAGRRRSALDGAPHTTRLRIFGVRPPLPAKPAPVAPVPAVPAPAPVPPAVSMGHPSSAAPCGQTTGAPAWQHVVWVIMENTGYSGIIGASAAPYLNGLAARCGLATQYFAITHPSLPNYIAMTSGSPQGIHDDADPSAHPLAAPSIFSQLGTDWRSLQESMPVTCGGTSKGSYAPKHNPAAYYTNVAAACATQDVPLADPPDLSARFTFVTPNLCHDMHDCSVAQGDAWLAGWMPKVLDSPQYQSGTTAVFVTWDEDNGSQGNRVATLVLAPSTQPGTTSATTFSHYSLLRTTEEMLGLPPLAGAATAVSMRAAFGL
ncbi:acid phosphatase [Baekduia soli]|uniref:Acid phosphatase n=1 Tax=Baekduia soli TaxID=496014 RepID=A0A5B8U504_9ACTN|nr:alkaline phosphatase family protein [Baekduia soli]QEC47928.1 acid phosphatase [Baekduia soli]